MTLPVRKTANRFPTVADCCPAPIPRAAALRRITAPMTVTAAVLGCMALSSCEQADRPPDPPTISLSVSAETVEEAGNPTVQLVAQLDSPALAGVIVWLNFEGTATRDRDYAASADAIMIPPNATAGSLDIDVYRDFDDEGDETVTAVVARIAGHARVNGPASATFSILDGESAVVDKALPEGGAPELTLLPFHFGVTEGAVVMVLAALNASPDGQPARLVAEWSTDIDFLTGVQPLGEVEVPAHGDPFDFFFGAVHEFVLPLDRLEPDRSYFVRAWLGDTPPNPEPNEPVQNLFLEGFATDAAGRVRTRCETPARTPGAIGMDPLFAEQWHLVNTGQTAFSNRPGTAGADLRMGAAIASGHGGEGVKIAIVDTGLEICHPDLAANTAAGGSFNFAHETTPGALSSDPFNQSILGDHGTSVAGVAAAVANNGFGGRGVAPEVALVGFNVGQAGAEGSETALIRSLGASESDPDSASVDIFNMSFGSELPSENATEDFVRVLKMGTSELRSGRGALYVKAAGNEFELCNRAHPLNREIGCISGNADPEQNLPYLIAVGAFNAGDVKSSYSNAGANLWVVGPGGEDGFERPAMITTDQAGAGAGFGLLGEIPLSTDHPLNRDGDYVNAFGGTSSASPAVAGAVAVLLGVKPSLTWRDVKHILAVTARRIDPGRAEVRAAFNGTPYVAQHAWQTNAAGHDYHNWYGFGAVDIDAAVALAQSTYAPGSVGTLVESEWFESGADDALALAIPDADGAGVTAVLDVTGLPASANVEAVVLEIDIEHSDAYDLGITLHSPAGTASVLNPPFNAVLEDFPGLRNWQLLSNAFYGENPNGAWTVHVADLAAEDTGSLTGWKLRFFHGEHP